MLNSNIGEYEVSSTRNFTKVSSWIILN
jgi:hypothetical protein